MNSIRSVLVIGLLLWLTASGVVAQTNATSEPVRTGQSVSPEKLTANDISASSNLRPTRLERQNLPPEVKDRIERFRKDARAYLEQQQQLKKQLEGANDKERAAVREQMKQLREQWLEKARELRKEFRDRAEELKVKLPDLEDVLNSARAAAQETTRDHRGEERY